MICSRCGHSDIPSQAPTCPNCGFQLKKKSRSLTTTTSFRALSARRKMLTERHYTLPFALGEEVFGRFKVRDLLGQGPLGVVYLVTDDRGDERSLKVIHKRWRTEMDLDALQGAYLTVDELQERKLLNLPTEVLIQDEYVGLLSPNITGLTVRKVMSLRKTSSKAFKIEELQQLVSGVGQALEHLHSVGVAHGGIKPENFFVSTNEELKQQVTLSDTCLASGVGIEAYHRAQRAAGLGHYLAPEVVNGELTLASDIFSLGAFIFEGLTGHAYQSKKSVKELLPIQGIEPLEVFLARALNVDPEERHASISALLEDFTAVTTQLIDLEGSPFNSSETEPRGDSIVARFSAESDSTSIDRTDPLLGASPQDVSPQSTPPPLPANASIIGLATPPPLPNVATPIIQPRSGLLHNATPSPISSNHTPSGRELIQQLSSSNVKTDQERSLDMIPILPDEINSTSDRKSGEDPDLIPAQLTRGVPQLRPRRTVVSQKSSSSNGLFFWGSTLSLLLAVAFGVYSLLGAHDSDDPQLRQQQSQGVAVSLPADKDPLRGGATTKSSSSSLSTTSQLSIKDSTADQVAADKAATADKAAALKAVADKAAAQKAATDKAAADKAAAQKAAADKAAAQKAAADKAAAQKAAADKAAADKAAADKAAADKAAADKAAAQKAAADKAAVQRAAAEKAKKLSASRSTQAQERDEATRKAEAKRKERERAEAKRKAEERAEAQRKERERAEAERKARAENAAKRVPPKAQVKISATELKCPSGMRLKTTARFPRGSVRRGKIKGKKAIALALSGKAYCIDVHEYPGRGQRPKTNVTFKGAQSLCAQANKRLCTPNEWKRACVGRGGAAYPYGKSFNPSKCATEDAEGEERRLMKSGSMKKCKSASGVYDMSGNVAEWTEGQRVFGGYYASDEDDSKCSAGGRRSPSTRRGYIGFRCCADFRQ